MDESEKRRERLKAMRTEAAQAGVPVSSSDQFHGGLANPLTEALPLLQEPRSNTRCDFYTDPMASYAANRRTGATGPAPRGFAPTPGNEGVPLPMRQIAPRSSTGSWDPRVSMRPYSQFETNHLHNPTNYQARGFYSPPARLPYGTPMYSEYPCPPGVHSQSGPAFRNHLQSNFLRGENVPNFTMVQSGRKDFGHGQGRGQSSRGFHQGRGHGNWSNNSVKPLSRQSDNRDTSDHRMPQSFYGKFMVEDPWKFLKPSLWRRAKSETSNIASLTVGVKRPSEVARPSVPDSQSLAEYLADSFSEAVKGDSDA